MEHPRRSQDRIIELLSEVQPRLSQGESLASICKSLGVSQSSYRRWRIKYRECAKENAVAVANESSEQRASAPPTSTENILTKPAGAHPNSKVPKLSEEAKQLLDEANGASDPARNAWLAFLALLTYLLVTLASVSDKDLLLNRPVKLPIVDVDIPLFSFFQYAPAMLLLVYLSLLIQHAILAGKYRKFAEAIVPYERETRTKHPARELVHSYVVSQILAGPKRSLIIRSLMRLMVFVTFALLPVITLLYFQIKFLPYHEVWTTYWHRIAVLLGLGMLFAILPIIHLKSRKREFKFGPQGETWQASPYGISFGAAIATLVICFSWLIATVPEERLEELNPLVRLSDERAPLSFQVLVVEDTDLVPDEGDTREISVVLRNRNLQFARLSGSDLHRADLTNADLRGAVLRSIRLEKAKLRKAKLQGADLTEENPVEVYLSGNLKEWKWGTSPEDFLAQTDLPIANFQVLVAQGKGANLKDADLTEAKLEGAKLIGAQLQGAKLAQANLQARKVESGYT